MKIKLFITIWIYMFIVFFLKIFLRRKKTTTNSLLFLENFPIENSGYQYRANKWIPYLNEAGFDVKIWTIYESKSTFDHQIKHNRIGFFIHNIKIRFQQVLKSRNFSTVIVRRELLFQNDYGNLFMEKFLNKVHPNVILDFDDDLAAAKNQPRKIKNVFGKLLLEHGNKFNESLNIYKKFIVGSKYLKNLILERKSNALEKNICIIPTCVDYDKNPSKSEFFKDASFRFGWIGGDHNLPALDSIIGSLNEVHKFKEIELIIIAGHKPQFNNSFPIKFYKWSLQKEVEYLKLIDVGLMPVENTARGKAKCGFKLIQYMGLGIPSVASAVGANKEIVNHNQNSFLINPKSNWTTELISIINKKEILNSIGQKARARVMEKYTFSSNIDNYINFIKQSKNS